MSKKSKPKPKSRSRRSIYSRPHWKDIPDDVLLAKTPVRRIEKAESLSPTPGTMWRALLGVPEAMAIIDSYAFRFPVTVERMKAR